MVIHKYSGMRYHIKRDPAAEKQIGTSPVYRVHRQGTEHHDGVLYLNRYQALSQAKSYQRLEDATGEIRISTGQWWIGVPMPLTADSFAALMKSTDEELLSDLQEVGHNLAYSLWSRLPFAEVPNVPELPHIIEALQRRFFDLTPEQIGHKNSYLPRCVQAFYTESLEMLEADERLSLRGAE